MDQAQFRQLKSLLEPCQTADELDTYLRTWLKLELPWDTLDEDSTSAPLKLVWSVYKVLLTGQGPTKHVVAAARNTAKCLAEGTLVATPGGPIEIQNLRPGDVVYDENGNPCRVTELHDQGIQDCIALTRAGQTWAICTPSHVWQAFDSRHPNSKKEYKASALRRGLKVVRQELSQPLGTKHEPMAYALGAFFGDGCSTCCGIVISSKNDRIPNKIAKILGTEAIKYKSKNFSYFFRSPTVGKKWIFSDLYEKFIRGKRAHEKSLTWEEVKDWDRESRLEFLAGLIDTDGSVFMPKSHNRGQLVIKLGMQATSVVDVAARLIESLWQFPVKTKTLSRKYKNGPMCELIVSHNHFAKKIIKELDPYLVREEKKYKPEYDSLVSNNFCQEGVGFCLKSAGKRQCWDITVDTPTSLYCLQSGLVTHNTVGASVIQFMSLLHFRRDGAHIAAILDQSMTAIRYLDTYMNIPELVPYRKIDNVRIKQFINLPANDYTEKSEATLRVVTATKKGANSPRASLLTLDEVDLTPQAVISEVAYVADPTRDGHKFDPVFVYLSSRKTNDGPIQKLQDQAIDIKANVNKRIKLHKWSQVDFMEPCLPAIHKPELGQHHAYIHIESLETVWGKEQFEQGVSDSIKPQYKEVVAFEGCKTCPAFIACQGRSAKQRGDSPMLRTRQFVGDILEAVGDAAVIIAQSLNWKPESTAIVFKTFSMLRHVKQPIDFYEWCVGKRFDPDEVGDVELDRIEEEGTFAELARITPTKLDIYMAMRQAGWTIFAGVDWGYNPDPAVIIIAGFHKKTKRCAVLHTANALNHANHVWAQHIAEQIYPNLPFEWVGPDMADPASPTYFAKYKIRSLDTKPPRIETGVSFIRGLLWNPVTQQSGFAVLDDSMEYPGKQELGREQGNWMLISAMTRWTHLKRTTGEWDMSKFEDNKWTHPIDALRYGMDPLIEEAKISMSMSTGPAAHTLETRVAKKEAEAIAIVAQKNELMSQMSEHFESEFGIKNVFQKQNELAKQDPKKPKTPSGIKFKF